MIFELTAEENLVVINVDRGCGSSTNYKINGNVISFFGSFGVTLRNLMG